MVDVVRSESRTKARSQPRHFRWGIVDVILGVLMLPFGIWLLAIEGLVRAVAPSQKR